MPRKVKKNYIYAVGRRKESSARVRLFKGSEESTVNGELVGKYFPGDVARAGWTRPFEMLEIGTGKYYFTVKVVGGGKSGQLDAVIFGVSRALGKVKEDYRKVLRKAGLLTRDSRVRERRKVGMGGKARRKKQSPKR